LKSLNPDLRKKIIHNIMTNRYLLDQNIVITGNLILNKLINVKNEVTDIKNLSDIIGTDKEYEGNLTLDTLIISDKLEFTISVLGETTVMITTCVDSYKADSK
jgi:hypothetical protein